MVLKGQGVFLDVYFLRKKELMLTANQKKKKSLALLFGFVLSRGRFCLYFHLFQGIYFRLKILIITLSLNILL